MSSTPGGDIMIAAYVLVLLRIFDQWPLVRGILFDMFGKRLNIQPKAPTNELAESANP
jgi:hypothetical protein